MLPDKIHSAEASSSSSVVPPSLQMQMLHQAQDESAAAATAALTQDDDESISTESVSLRQATPRKVQSLDLDSISMFPSLGSSSSRPAAAATWGAGPSSRVKSAAGKLGAVGDQRRSPAAAQAQAAQAPRVNASGNIQERMQIPSVQMPVLGKTTVGDVCRRVTISSGARIESSTSQASGTTTFVITGKPEAVAKARRDLRSSFAKKVWKCLCWIGL